MPQVLKYIANENTISTSKLQRVFSIGYNRAANIIDHLQEKIWFQSNRVQNRGLCTISRRKMDQLRNHSTIIKIT